jgi:hypothetical protein
MQRDAKKNVRAAAFQTVSNCRGKELHHRLTYTRRLIKINRIFKLVQAAWLPDDTPKRGEIYQIVTKLTNGHKMYQMSVI